MMHAIIDTDTQDIGVFVWSTSGQAVLFIGADDLEGTCGYLNPPEIMTLILALRDVYNQVKPDRKITVQSERLVY